MKKKCSKKYIHNYYTWTAKNRSYLKAYFHFPPPYFPFLPFPNDPLK